MLTVVRNWYENRADLRQEQVFLTQGGERVKLDRTVPGDGSKWYVAEWDGFSASWVYMDATIEPGELREQVSE